jgi:tRNA-splicing ligase RtcB
MSDGMRVPGRIYATESLIPKITEDKADIQVANVAFLPGILNYSMAMPDIHWGYGFPIGGVAAFDLDSGVISPGGVGYDINCGVRLLRTDVPREQAAAKIDSLLVALFRDVPCGVGSKGAVRLKKRELDKVLLQGAKWAVKEGYGLSEDLEYIEEEGSIQGADPDCVSARAIERGGPQLGTLGSGNHFVEIGYVEEIYDRKIADVFGLYPNRVTVTIHTGSRGLGHQVCEDYIHAFKKSRYAKEIHIPDPQLECVPVLSEEGKKYYAAMNAAVNLAFANRQIISHRVREVLLRVLGVSPGEAGIRMVYEVAHNIAKIEEHVVDGKQRTVCVHRKGATRAFPPGHPEIPKRYRDTGQPVLIPGDMGRYSYVLAGTEKAMQETFGSTCHGAGRAMSRHEALKRAKGRSIFEEMAAAGIGLKSADRGTVAEEMPEAYKDVSLVVDAVDRAGISKKVARLRPMGVIKG